MASTPNENALYEAMLNMNAALAVMQRSSPYTMSRAAETVETARVSLNHAVNAVLGLVLVVNRQ
jgi:hypothetical protein